MCVIYLPILFEKFSMYEAEFGVYFRSSSVRILLMFVLYCLTWLRPLFLCHIVSPFRDLFAWHKVVFTEKAKHKCVHCTVTVYSPQIANAVHRVYRQALWVPVCFSGKSDLRLYSELSINSASFFFLHPVSLLLTLLFVCLWRKVTEHFPQNMYQFMLQIDAFYWLTIKPLLYSALHLVSRFSCPKTFTEQIAFIVGNVWLDATV